MAVQSIPSRTGGGYGQRLVRKGPQSSMGRGCVKTQEAFISTQQRNRRPGFGKILNAIETWRLNRSCVASTRQKVFTQPRSFPDIVVPPTDACFALGSGHCPEASLWHCLRLSGVRCPVAGERQPGARAGIRHCDPPITGSAICSRASTDLKQRKPIEPGDTERVVQQKTVACMAHANCHQRFRICLAGSRARHSCCREMSAQCGH